MARHDPPAARPNQRSASVDITTSGRGGSIYYREGSDVAVFEWDFAIPPVIALISGRPAHLWDRAYPWSAGRQAEIYEFVGAEVKRRNAADARIEVDLTGGVISVIEKPVPRGRRVAASASHPPARPTTGFARFLLSVVPYWQQWRDDQSYDVAAIAEMTTAEREKTVALLTGRDITWREVEALGAIDTEAARDVTEAALKAHLSIDTRLAAAEIMLDRGRLPDFDLFLARQIRLLHDPREGMARALRLAERHPSETVKQALLWASYNCTECAPHCAGLLLTLTGVDKEPFRSELQQLLRKLGLHNSSFDRQAAFDALCRLVGMTLDHTVVD